MAKGNKIKKYRKPLNLNIGMIIFGVILIYVIVCVIIYFQTGHIVRYEVQEGSLAVDNVYRGIIIRMRGATRIFPSFAARLSILSTAMTALIIPVFMTLKIL